MASDQISSSPTSRRARPAAPGAGVLWSVTGRQRPATGDVHLQLESATARGSCRTWLCDGGPRSTTVPGPLDLPVRECWRRRLAATPPSSATWRTSRTSWQRRSGRGAVPRWRASGGARARAVAGAPFVAYDVDGASASAMSGQSLVPVGDVAAAADAVADVLRSGRRGRPVDPSPWSTSAVQAGFRDVVGEALAS